MPPNLHIIPMKKGRRNILPNLIKIKRLLHDYNIMMCLANTHDGALYFALLSLVTKIDMKHLLIYVRDFQWRYLRFITYFLRDAKYLLPTSALLDRDDYIKRYINKNNFFITGDPVRINHADRQEPPKGDYILALANIAYWKGLIYLLQAYNKCGVYNSGVRLGIYGSVVGKKCYHELRNYVYEHNLYKAEKMTLLVNDRELAQTMGAHGYEKAIENFSAEKVTANILKALC